MLSIRGAEVKSQKEISQILSCYKKKLADAVEEKIEFDDALTPEIDIIIAEHAVTKL